MSESCKMECQKVEFQFDIIVVDWSLQVKSCVIHC